MCAVAVVFVGLFWSAAGIKLAKHSPDPASTSEVVKRGNYGHFLYAIMMMDDKNKKLAQFDPALPADDATVLSTLKAVAFDGYGHKMSESDLPTVESINDTNYITFATAEGKYFFELFRNSSGEVGSVRFWKE